MASLLFYPVLHSNGALVCSQWCHWAWTLSFPQSRWTAAGLSLHSSSLVPSPLFLAYLLFAPSLPAPSLPPSLCAFLSPHACRQWISFSLQQGSACNEAFVFVLWAGAVSKLNWVHSPCSVPLTFQLPTRPELSSLSPAFFATMLHIVYINMQACFWNACRASIQVPLPSFIISCADTQTSMPLCVVHWHSKHTLRLFNKLPTTCKRSSL